MFPWLLPAVWNMAVVLGSSSVLTPAARAKLVCALKCCQAKCVATTEEEQAAADMGAGERDE